MKRLLYDVSRWHLLLHREARRMARAADRDTPQQQIEDEMFERLYTGEPEPLARPHRRPDLRKWAEDVHAACERLPAFSRLSADCRGDAAAAAEAVEHLRSIIPPPPDPATPPGPPPAASSATSKDPLRRALAAACATATAAVAAQREQTDALDAVAFGHAPGVGSPPLQTRASAAIRSLAARLKTDARLRMIATLAGRFRRIAATKRRQRVRHGADEITDVEQGGLLERALPGELTKLAHPLLRLAFLRSLLERQALQYRLDAVTALGKGPLVVLLDKSGSMDGPRDMWATALSLALLDQARQERRMFALLAFRSCVVYEALVPVGGALPEEALFTDCAGGTDIAAALDRGLEIVATHPGAMRKADVVLITDGGSDAGTAPELRARAAAHGVTVLGFGIGVERAWLEPWCDHIQAVADLSTVSDAGAELLFGGG